MCIEDWPSADLNGVGCLFPVLCPNDNRGVSRKARRHIIKIRMPESPAPAQAANDSVPTEELVTPHREGRPDALTALASSTPEDRRTPTPQQPEPGAAGGDADAVVAVKVWR